MTDIQKFRQQCIGSLLGGAIGDILGMPVEGWKREQIQQYVGKITEPITPVQPRDKNGNIIIEDEFGKIKSWNSNANKGEYSDDTILSIVMAETVLEKGYDLETVAQKHIEAYESYRTPDGTIAGGFGGTTREAIENLRRGVHPYESGVIGGPGNAPAMKMGPVGLYMVATASCPGGLRFAHNTSKMTHLDPRSIASGVLQAYAVYKLVHGTTRDKFLEHITLMCKKQESQLTSEFTYAKSGTLLSRLEWIRDNKDASDDDAYKELGCTSVVYRSYPFAIFMFQKYWDKPLEGLIETVNYGGDCDTTGAIYGTLAGAKNGVFFPQEWVAQLQNHEKIIKIAENISYTGLYGTAYH